MDFQRTYSGAPWEGRVGYCRACVLVTISTSRVQHRLTPRAIVTHPATRTRKPSAAWRLSPALCKTWGPAALVVRTRLFVTDIRRWEEYGRAHREAFAGNPPATSMVQVSSLIDPAMLVEIEADAVCPTQG